MILYEKASLTEKFLRGRFSAQIDHNGMSNVALVATLLISFTLGHVFVIDVSHGLTRHTTHILVELIFIFCSTTALKSPFTFDSFKKAFLMVFSSTFLRSVIRAISHVA